MDDDAARPTVNHIGSAYVEPPVAADAPPGESFVPGPPPTGAMGWRGLLLALAVIWAFSLGSQLIAGMAIGVLAAINDADPMSLFMQPVVIVPLSILGSVVAVSVGWYFACSRTGAPVSEGLAIRPVSAAALALGGGLGLAAALVVVFISWGVETSNSIMGDLVAVDSGDGRAPRPSLLMLAFAIIMPPLEEMYYRGFLYTAFRRLATVNVAFPLICVWFGGIHAFQLAGDWVFLGIVVTMGVLWTWLRERYQSVLVSLASHWIYNGALAGFALVTWMLGA